MGNNCACINTNKYYVKIINTDRYEKIDKCHNYGKYPYNLPNEEKDLIDKDGCLNCDVDEIGAPNTLKYNDEIFNSKSECTPNGLYYTKIKYTSRFMPYGNTLCIVKPMKNAKIVRVKDKYKTNKLYIIHAMDLWDIHTIKFLIKNKADINIIFCLASKYGKFEILKYLMEFADRRYINVALSWAAIKHDNFEIIQYLIDCGARITYNVFYHALLYGNLEIIKYLYEQYFILDCTKSENEKIVNQMLWKAADKGYLSIVQYAVETCKANVDEYGDCAVSWAHLHGHFDIVEYLGEHGVNINGYYIPSEPDR